MEKRRASPYSINLQKCSFSQLGASCKAWWDCPMVLRCLLSPLQDNSCLNWDA